MKLILIITTLLFSTNIFADSSVGCGLGQVVVKKNSIVSATSRVIINHITSSQFLGTTFGTSGCSKHNIVMANKETIHYANANIEKLKLEMAIGSGEYLTNFASTFRCSYRGVQQFADKSKSNYSKLFKNYNTTPDQLIENINHVFSRDETINSLCSFVTI